MTSETHTTFKPSGIEWMGDIPSHWEVKPLKHIADIALGKMLTSDDKGGQYLKPYLRSANIAWGSVDIEDVKEMWFTEHELNQLRLQRFDLLLSEGGEVGRTSIWLEELPECYIQNSVHRVRCSEVVIPKFLFYMSLTYGKSGYYDSIVNRISLAHLTVEKLINIKFPLPPLSEQKAIATFLDQKTAKIDAFLEKKQALLELLAEERKALINQAVTRGITPGVALKPSGIDWIGDIPAHWEVKRLKRIVSLKSGESITSDSIYPEGEYQVFGGNGLRGYTNQFTHEGEFILIGRQGALCGNVTIANGKFWASEHALVVSLLVDLSLNWLFQLLDSMNLNQYSQSAAQPGLSVDIIRELFIPVPTPIEQESISAFLDQKTAQIDQTSARIRQEMDLLREYRQALITEAVLGRVAIV